MSHFLTLVITPQKPDDTELAKILSPWYEGDSERNENARWDWWMVGGRWSGFLQLDYDPAEDPRNIETCDLCKGTGKRNDGPGQQQRRIDPTYTCNGCGGKGKAVKWPTQWAQDVPGNQCQIKDLPAGVRPSLAVVHEGKWYERGKMGWFGVVHNEKPDDQWNEEHAKLIKGLPPETWLTVVDCHI